MADNVTRLPGARKRKVRNGIALRSDGNVEILKTTSSVPTPPERVLCDAADTGLTDAIVIGWDLNGEFYYNGSMPDGADALWLLQLAKDGLFGR